VKCGIKYLVASVQNILVERAVMEDAEKPDGLV
jgi:hypothetical protein